MGGVGGKFNLMVEEWLTAEIKQPITLFTIWHNKATIIVKSVGKVAFLPVLFLPPPAPGPMLIKTLMFVRVIVLLYPNIEQGGRGIFSKRENSLFSGLKWTTVKLYNLPNYFCLWLSENSGCGCKRSKIDHFLPVETSSKNTVVKSTLLKKNICRTLLRQFWAHTLVYIRHVLQPGKYNYCSFRGAGRGPKYKCMIIFGESYWL